MERTRAVRARGISKQFGNVVALDGVDLDVPAGQIHGLVGPNGAGKTTLLGLLLGLSVPDRGTLEILGRSVRRALDVAGVAGFVDGPGLYPSLSARQNLAAVASLSGDRTHTGGRADDALEQVGLSGVADDRVGGFSLGMRQRLGLATALLTEPRLLVLDEPANGLDPAGKHQVHRVLVRLTEQGTSVVLSSHRMDDLAALCPDVTILATGRVVFSGPVTKLATESGDLDHRIVTPDARAARRVVSETPGVRLRSAEIVPPVEHVETSDAIVVRGSTAGLDDLVRRLVVAGVAIRELTPVVPPLEAAFLALTEEARS
jgi:ABC-2 type transport system ATP-binding protein